MSEAALDAADAAFADDGTAAPSSAKEAYAIYPMPMRIPITPKRRIVRFMDVSRTNRDYHIIAITKTQWYRQAAR